MARTSLLGAALLALVTCARAEITAAEYFFDNAALPEGSGIALTVSSTAGVGNLQSAIDLSGLAVGPHVLYVRFQDAGGSWSAPTAQAFAVSTGSGSPGPELAAAEAFLGVDPGNDNATSAGTSSETIARFAAALPTGAVNGQAEVGVRVKDADGEFSETLLQPLVRLANLPDDAPAMARAEAFLDNDPGTGNATLLGEDAGASASFSSTLPLAGAGDVTRVGLRLITSDGDTGLVDQVFFLPVARLQPESTAAIDHIEFFTGGDPGLDDGIALTLLPSGPLGIAAFGRGTTRLAALAAPFDTLSVRARSAAGGLYSLSTSQPVNQRDSDFDRIVDLIDVFPRNPFEWRDTDNDGIGNNADPDIDGDGLDNAADDDDDNDGLPDLYEQERGLDPRDPVDALLDPDADGLSSADEFLIGSDPLVADTDGDGVIDGEDPTPLTVGVIDPVPTPGVIGVGDRFGSAVAIEESFFLAGAPFEDDGGAAFVYRVVGDQPVQDGELRIPPEFAGAQFGGAVAIAGDIAVVGAPGFVPPAARKNNQSRLQAAIFQRTQAGWEFKQPLVSDDPAGSDQFGASVAISGNRILVGAPRDDEGVVDSGAVYAFDLSNGVFELADKLKPASPNAGQLFGSSLAAGGGRVAVGAPGSVIDQATRGSVSIYSQIGDNLSPQREVTGSGALSGAEFGRSVSLTGEMLVVGAPGETSGEGAIYGYDPASATETMRLQATDGAGDDRFGTSVSVDEERIIVGAPNAAGNGSFYEFSGATGSQLGRITAIAGQTRFGEAVGVVGDRVIVGAPATGQDSGALSFQRDPRRLFKSGFER